MRRCFQCGTKIDAAQLVAVADGEFCPPCFRQLLAAGAERSTSEVEPVQSSGLRRDEPRAPAAASHDPNTLAPRRPSPTPPSSRRSKSRACLVCERDIRGEAAISFLGGDICAACNRQMERELREADAAPAHATERAPSSAPVVSAAVASSPAVASPAVPTQAVPAALVASFTPGGETRWCAGCERPMPGPGSYRVIAGEPYCPACVPFYASLDLGARPRHPTPIPTGAASASGEIPACDCCGASLEPGAGQHEGFSFCQACFTSDRELALSVARVRHRRKLEALRASFDPEKK